MPESVESSQPSRRGRSGWYVALVILLLTGAAVWWVSQRDASQAPGPSMGRGMRTMAGFDIPVRVAVADTRVLDYTLKAIGTVTALNTVVVRSRVDGELLELSFDEGQYVNQGDVLARIDPRSFQVQLDQALGQQAQNKAQLQLAEQDLKRYQTLSQQQSIARQQLDTQAALVAQLRASNQSDQAAVDQARLQLSFTEVRAPLSGRVGLRQVDVGNLVSAGGTDGLVTITQVQPISVRFSLPQANLADVQTGMRRDSRLSVAVYGADDTTLLDEGEVVAVDNQIDIATGTFSVKATLPNADEQLFPNQFVNVRLRVDSGESLAIPTVAVQYGSIGAFVYVVAEDQTVRVQEVVPGRTDGLYSGIIAGLSAGDRVVTEGVDRLREGSRVDVIDDEAKEHP